MILQRGKAESGWARAAFGGNRRFARLGESQPPAMSSFAWASGRLQLGAAFELPGSLGESNLDHKFKMTVLTNTISAFIFGFRKGMMALPQNHY